MRSLRTRTLVRATTPSGLPCGTNAQHHPNQGPVATAPEVAPPWPTRPSTSSGSSRPSRTSRPPTSSPPSTVSRPRRMELDGVITKTGLLLATLVAALRRLAGRRRTQHGSVELPGLDARGRHRRVRRGASGRASSRRSPASPRSPTPCCRASWSARSRTSTRSSTTASCSRPSAPRSACSPSCSGSTGPARCGPRRSSARA